MSCRSRASWDSEQEAQVFAHSFDFRFSGNQVGVLFSDCSVPLLHLGRRLPTPSFLGGLCPPSDLFLDPTGVWGLGFGVWGLGFGRSEEHTSELQSQSNLVCRLLLEKK